MTGPMSAFHAAVNDREKTVDAGRDAVFGTFVNNLCWGALNRDPAPPASRIATQDERVAPACEVLVEG